MTGDLGAAGDLRVAGAGADTRDEDAATVVAVLAALASRAAASDMTSMTSPAAGRALWGDVARRLGAARPGPHRWWASGLPV